VIRNTVLPFDARRLRADGAAASASGRGVVWSVAELPDERECADWLDHVIVGTPYENTALSLWRNQPNLRLSTEKLAGFITPLWPAADGSPLLRVAVEHAVRRAQEAIDQGQAFEGRLVGVYLYGLLGVIADIAQVVVRGEDAEGQMRRWPYFSQPLLQWARQHGIGRLQVHRTAAPPAEVVLSGLRTHMTACLTDPLDAGYLARHAAQG
jgi:hypothetical protein